MVTASAAMRSVGLLNRGRDRPLCAMDTLGVVAQLALKEYRRKKRRLRRRRDLERRRGNPRRDGAEEEPMRQLVDSVRNNNDEVTPPLHHRAAPPRSFGAEEEPVQRPVGSVGNTNNGVTPPEPVSAHSAADLRYRAPPRRSTNRRPPRRPNVVSSLSSAVPQEPPEPIKSAIAAMEGTEATLVIEKGLTKSDTKKGENRLSIPMQQVANLEFLTEEEAGRLFLRDEKRKLVGIEARMVEPDGRDGTITLKRWDMEKEDGSINSSYVLNRTWFDMVRRHGLRPGTHVQVWSFRLHSALCFALAVIT